LAPVEGFSGPVKNQIMDCGAMIASDQFVAPVAGVSYSQSMTATGIVHTAVMQRKAFDLAPFPVPMPNETTKGLLSLYVT